MMKKAFTLIEVNLAILVVAGGVLSVVVLYSLGYRETRQGREDIASSVYADAVLNPLVAALGSTNVNWSTFRNIKCLPGEKGWGEYINSDGEVMSSPEGKASSTFSTTLGKGDSRISASFGAPSTYGLGAAGLVVMHEQDSAIVKIGFRASKRASTLLSAPLYYTEVVFQGDPTK